MRKRSTSRIVNGVVAAVVVVIFAVHGLLGGFETVAPIAGPPRWIVWAGVAAVAFHVVASVVTSREQLVDREFPPSARKKRHLVLKWVTGGVLAVAVGVHMACMMTGHSTALVSSCAMVVVAAMLAVHICVGAKSLLSDLALSKGLMLPLRIVTCVVAVAIACLVIAGCL